MSALSGFVPAVPSYGALRGVADAARARAEERRSAALAIVVATVGAVQRVRGSMALLDAGGICAGTLSGGALEGQLERAAQTVLDGGRAHVVTIDVADETASTTHAVSDHRDAVQVLILPLPIDASALRDAIVSACTSSAWLRLRLGLGRNEDDRRDLGRGE
ncbi:MAG: XdhC family protein, partial [Dokdonella sp.]